MSIQTWETMSHKTYFIIPFITSYGPYINDFGQFEECGLIIIVTRGCPSRGATFSRFLGSMGVFIGISFLSGDSSHFLHLRHIYLHRRFIFYLLISASDSCQVSCIAKRPRLAGGFSTDHHIDLPFEQPNEKGEKKYADCIYDPDEGHCLSRNKLKIVAKERELDVGFRVSLAISYGRRLFIAINGVLGHHSRAVFD